MRRPESRRGSNVAKLAPILGTAIADVGAKRVVPNTAVSWAECVDVAPCCSIAIGITTYVPLDSATRAL